MTDTKNKTQNVIPPFGIEIDMPRNNDAVIVSIPGCRLRGAIKARAGVRNILPGMPEVPGMQLHVNPAKLICKIVDPLTDKKNEGLCASIAKALGNSPIVDVAIGNYVAGVPDREETLNVDAMKCLCREMVWLLDAGQAKMVSGPRPSLEDINDLPGRYLVDPANSVSDYTQPRYEDQVEAFRMAVATGGGS